MNHHTMLKITRESDYALLVMTHLAKHPPAFSSATVIAAKCHLSVAIVSKILKLLTKKALLVSIRGAHGGYQLARSSDNISIADILTAIEGPFAINACADQNNPCAHTVDCVLAPHWIKINQLLFNTLSKISITSLCQDNTPHFSADHEYAFPIQQLMVRKE